MTKKASGQLKSIESYLNSTCMPIQFMGDTVAWKIQSSIYGDYIIKNICISNNLAFVFGAFVDESKFEVCNYKFGSNKFTGKFNFLANTVEDTISSIDDFIRNLNQSKNKSLSNANKN